MNLKDIEDENVEFLADELPIIGAGQQPKGSICKSDISSSSMDGDDDDQADFRAYLNVDLESNADTDLEVNADLNDVAEDENVSSNILEEVSNLKENTSTNSSTCSSCCKCESVSNEEKDVKVHSGKVDGGNTVKFNG